MRLVVISDTHNYHDELILPDGDVLIHCGDATIMGSVPEVHDFSLWWNKQKFKHKLFLPGNHDRLWSWNQSAADSLIPSIHEKEIEIDGVRFYGCSWVPEFGTWSFMLPRGPLLKLEYAKIPHGTDVLITHGPPHGVLDENKHGLRVGDYDLRDRVRAVAPKIHCFGHIHDSYGKIELNDTLYANASICDEAYYIANEPLVLDI